MNDFLDPNLKKDKGIIFIDLSQKGQKGQEKDFRQKYSGLFVLLRPKTKITPFLTGCPKKDKNCPKKDKNCLKKDKNCPKKDKEFIFY